MKKIILLSIVAILFSSARGQSENLPEPNPVVMITWIYENPHLPKEDTIFKGIRLDSLINWYVDKGIRPNPLIKNFRLLDHYWGEDSYKMIFLYEVDGFANLNKAEEKTVELIEANFKTKEEKNLFWRRWYLIFNRHSDNILSDRVKPKTE